jgi:large subunit ribosomal protein L4
MQLKLIDANESVTVSDQVFGKKFNEGLVHQVVTAYLAEGRQGTKAQKTKAQVRGGGAKPWKQKGTGRARAGSIRSPLWRGGGVTFAATPRQFGQKVNKKAYKHAISSILSELIRQDRLSIVDVMNLVEPKTKELIKKLQELQLNKVLIIVDEENTNLSLAARNIPYVEVCKVTEVNPVNLIAYDRVLFIQSALKKIEERLQ